MLKMHFQHIQGISTRCTETSTTYRLEPSGPLSHTLSAFPTTSGKPFGPSWEHNRCAAPCVPAVKSHDVSPISNSSRRDARASSTNLHSFSALSVCAASRLLFSLLPHRLLRARTGYAYFVAAPISIAYRPIECGKIIRFRLKFNGRNMHNWSMQSGKRNEQFFT